MRTPDPFATLFAGLAKAKSRASRPYVTLSYAQSLDGSIAGGAVVGPNVVPNVASGGTEQTQALYPTPLSSPESLIITHRLRAAHDGILVGIGTVLADNPRLTVRYLTEDESITSSPSPQPVVLDARLRFPPTAALLDHPRPPWIATHESQASQPTPLADSSKALALTGRGVRLLPLPMDKQGYLSLPHLLAELAASGMRTLMVEGGAQVISSFVREGLVDLLVVTITPYLVGGLHGLRLAGASLESLPRLQAVHWQPAGPDWIVWGALC